MLKYVNHDIVFREFPDEVTLAINLSCCPNGCTGCHSAYLRGDVGEELTLQRLEALIESYAGEITCVALMGGRQRSANRGIAPAVCAPTLRPPLQNGLVLGTHAATRICCVAIGL